VGAGVRQPLLLVGQHPLVEAPEPVPELADSAGRQVAAGSWSGMCEQ
jgi:hypothetical protein